MVTSHDAAAADADADADVDAIARIRVQLLGQRHNKLGPRNLSCLRRRDLLKNMIITTTSIFRFAVLQKKKKTLIHIL